MAKTKKMLELSLPDQPTDPIRLADWLEIYALISADGNASRGDIERALRRASVFQSDESAEIEEALLKVFFELEDRSAATGDGYPFEIKGGVIKLRSKPKDFPAYIFCLVLSYFGWQAKRGATINPRNLFEELSCKAAKHYIQGEVFPFGPTAANRKGFKEAVAALCNALGEGQGFKDQPTFQRKDDKVDLVAWKVFRDRRTSKLVMFGQCASGNDWKDKFAELQTDAFWAQWMQDGQISPLIRSFYVPHRVDKAQWDYTARRAGLLFDRCRIAYWAASAPEIQKDSRYLRWSMSYLPIRSK
ncbi:MAG: hypothetical protein ACYCPQ_00520 [Elusimicrobiota bacterium]